jgi:hypothetical protein
MSMELRQYHINSLLYPIHRWFPDDFFPIAGTFQLLFVSAFRIYQEFLIFRNFSSAFQARVRIFAVITSFWVSIIEF